MAAYAPLRRRAGAAGDRPPRGMIRRRPHRPDDATPRLLLAFLAATLAMVLAIAELRRSGSDWVDFVAIAFLLVLAALVLTMIRRELDEEAPPEDGDTERPVGRWTRRGGR
jgi:hypothetical protein